MKHKLLLHIFSGFLAAGLALASCKKDAQAPSPSQTGKDPKPLEKTIAINNSQSHLNNDPNAIPIKERLKTTAYFRKLLKDKGINDEKTINGFLQEQEHQMQELEGINAFKKYKQLKRQQMQEWQNGAAMHGACPVNDFLSTGGFQYQPIVTVGWTSGYGPGELFNFA